MRAIGSEYKINVHVEPLDGLHMADYDFECEFYAYSRIKVIRLRKDDMLPVDNDNYIAIITSEMSKTIGRGMVKLRFKAYIPDGDFPDGLRTEISEVCTGITIS